MLRQLAALLLILVPAAASAQTGVVSGASVTATGSTTSRTLADRAAQIQDVRNFFQGTSANCATDVSPAVNAAVTAGVKRIWLPASCTYIPTNNTTPADVEIDGEDWQTSVISVDNRATHSLSLGPRSVLRNVATISMNCDVNSDPFSTQKLCPVGTAINNQDVAQSLNNWVREGFTYWSGSVTQGGVTSTDVPGIASVITSTGGGSDAFFAGSNGTGSSGLRVVIGGGGNGIYALNGQNGSTTTGRNGVFVEEFTGNNSGSFPLNASFRIDRKGDGTSDVQQSFRIDDSDSTQSTNTSDAMVVALTHQASGNMIDLFQSTDAFSGTGLMMNFGAGGGTYTGNFMSINLNGVNKFLIKNNGGIADQAQSDFATAVIGQTTSQVITGQGELGFVRQGTVTQAPTAAGAKIVVVCGTNAGTAKLEMVAGTSTTPVTIVDNVGTGVSGC